MGVMGKHGWWLHRNENNIDITDGPLSLLLDTAFVVVVVCFILFCFVVIVLLHPQHAEVL